MWKFLSTLIAVASLSFAMYTFVLSPGYTVDVSEQAIIGTIDSSTQLAMVSPTPMVASTLTLANLDNSLDTRFAGLLSHVRWLMENRYGNASVSDSGLTRFDKQFESLSDDIGDASRDVQDNLESDGEFTDATLTLPIFDGPIASNLSLGNYYLSGDGDDEGILVDSTGKVSIGTSAINAAFNLGGAAYLAQISAPASTTDKLYNLAGDLYWAGNLVGGGSVGNWATNGTDVWRAGGNVGIGTTTPSFKLDVVTSGGIRTSYGDVSLVTYGNGVGASFIDSVSLDNNTLYDLGFEAQNHRFYTGNSDWSNFGERMTITSVGNVGIGTSTPTAKLTIDNSGSDTNPLVVKTNGSVGNYTATNSAMFFYDAGGNETLRIYASDPDVNNNYNSGNLYIGRLAGQNQPTDNSSAGYFNTGVGERSLKSNTTGYWNSGFGAHSLINNTTGYGNNAIGNQALEYNLTGSENAAIGLQALGSNISGDLNIAVGQYALLYNTIGSGNTGIGSGSGFNLSNDIAQYRIVGDTDMVLLGYGATKNNASTLTNGIAIGSGAHVLQSNQVVLGNDSITSTLLKGNVGIGTTTPDRLLTVHSSAAEGLIKISTGLSTKFAELSSGGAGGSDVYLKLDASNAFNVPAQALFDRNGTTYWAMGLRGDVSFGDDFFIGNADNDSSPEFVISRTSGNVGIGDTSPAALLTVGGGDLFQVNSSGAIAAATGITSSGLLNVDAGGTLDGHQIGSLNIDYSSNFNPQLSGDGDGLIIDSDLYLRNTHALISDSGHTSGLLLKAGRAATDIVFSVSPAVNYTYSEAMRINSDGNVGIGSTTPNSKLTIQNTTTGNSLIVEDQANDTTPFVIDATGSIGIGLVNPTNQLTIQRTESASGGSGPSQISLISSYGGNVLSGYSIGGIDFVSNDLGFASTTAQIKAIASASHVDGVERSTDLAFFTTTGTKLSESMRVDADGNVGIGTTSPGYKLQVVGDIGIASDTGQLSPVRLYTSGDNGLYIKQTENVTNGNSILSVLDENDNTRFLVTEQGNIGIGTTTPSDKLNVYGDTTLDGDLTLGNNGFLKLESSGLNYINGANPSTTFVLNANEYFQFKRQESVIAQIGSGGSGGLTYFTSNVGIGTTTPTDKFVVDGTVTDFSFVDNADSLGLYNTTAGAGALKLTRGAHTWGIAVNNSGNLSIGNTFRIHPTSGIFGNNAAAISGYDGALTQVTYGFDGDSNTGMFSTGADTLGFVTGATERLRITSAGDVGIGVANPGALLEIAGSSTSPGPTFRVTNTRLNLDGNSDISNIDFYNSDSSTGGTGVKARIRTLDDGSGVNGRDIAMAFHTANGTNLAAERMRISSAGNVGIGTTSPGAKLHIEGTDGPHVKISTLGGLYPLIRLERPAQNTWDIGMSATNPMGANGFMIQDTLSGDFPFAIADGADSNSLVINSLGNVGIGTSTPAQKLQVFGDIRIGTSTINSGCLEDYDGGSIAGTCSSDERLKTNIKAIADSETESFMERFAQLDVVTYKWNGTAAALYSKNQNAENLGLLAQDVEDVFPELVTENTDGYKQIDFRAFPFYIIEALKELWVKVSGNTERIDELEAENELLKDRLEAIEGELDVVAPTPAPEPESEEEPEPETEEEIVENEEVAEGSVIEEEVVDEEISEEETEGEVEPSEGTTDEVLSDEETEVLE